MNLNKIILFIYNNLVYLNNIPLMFFLQCYLLNHYQLKPITVFDFTSKYYIRDMYTNIEHEVTFQL